MRRRNISRGYTWNMKFGDEADGPLVKFAIAEDVAADAVAQQAAQMHVQLVNLVEQGLEPPLHIVTLSATGVMTLGRWGLDGEAMAYTSVSHHFPRG